MVRAINALPVPVDEISAKAARGEAEAKAGKAGKEGARKSAMPPAEPAKTKT
jgi:hypothetical protein